MINRLLGTLVVGLWLCGGAFAQGWFPLAASAAADLNFADNTGISGNITVTRSTQETCEPVGGVITYAAANNACITASGLQVYEAGTNLVPRSAGISTGWAATNGALTTGASGTAPDSTASALVMTDNSTNSVHTFQTSTFSFPINSTYTYSIYLKAGVCAQTTHECNYAAIGPTVTIGSQFIDVDLSTCLQVGGNAGAVKYKLIPLANGWCHVYFTLTNTSASTIGGLLIGMLNAIPQNGGLTRSYVGAGSTILFWGAQANASASFLPYCPTTGASATCNADVIAAAGPLKTALEGAALRAVFTVSDFREGEPSTLLGVGTALTGLGVAAGYQAQTNWPITVALKTAGQIVKGEQVNYIGLSADASGRSLAMNGQTAISDANGLSATAAERIGSLSTSAAFCDCVIARIRVWASRDDAAMLVSTANSAALPLLASYTGEIASNTRIAQTFLPAATATQAMSRTYHHFDENGATLQVKFANYYVVGGGTSETAPGAPTPITASIEYPAGMCTPFQFSGIATGTIPDGGTLLNDILSINHVAGDEFWIRAYRTNTVKITFSSTVGENSIYGGESIHYGTTGIADQTVSCGAITNTSTTGNYWPEAIVGLTQLHTYCLLGDSRLVGLADAISDSASALGEVNRWVHPYYSTINMGVGGDEAVSFIGSHANRITNLQYCSGMIDEFGVNDINAGRTAAQVEADLQTIYGYNTFLNGGSGPVWQTTPVQITTSTDSWATVANQTPFSAAAQLNLLNGWIRANTAGIAGYFENSNAVATAQNSDLWKANSLPFGWTADGIHEVQFAYLNIKNLHGFPATLH